MPNTDKPTKDKETAPHNINHHDWSISNTPLLIVIAVMAALILLGGGFAIGNRSSSMNGPGPIFGQAGLFARKSGGMGAHRHGFLNNSSTRVSGVVTAVNGTHFTVASQGSTKDVETNSSTQYVDGSSVAVNDSVVASGTTTGSQFTADRVVINP